MQNNITGVILAGGKSSRMNHFPKGLMLVEGKRSAERVEQALRAVSSHIIVSANTHDYDYLGLPVYPDEVQECGPLGGIYTALGHTNTPYCLVVACDTPFVTGDFLKYLVSQCGDADICVPEESGNFHPLCALYHTRCIIKMKEMIEHGTFKMQEVIRQCTFRSFDPEAYPAYSPSLLNNINTPEELKKLTGKG